MPGRCDRCLRKCPTPEASVAATDNLLPHVSGRRAVLRFPTLTYRNDAGEVTMVDFVLVDFWQLQQYAIAFSGSQERLQEWLPVVQALINEQNYGVVAATPGVFLLQRGAPADAAALARWQAFQAAFGS